MTVHCVVCINLGYFHTAAEGTVRLADNDYQMCREHAGWAAGHEDLYLVALLRLIRRRPAGQPT